MGSLSFKENEMTMQLIRTPQEKAGMAFHEAQLSSVKMQQIKNFITILETYKSDLESIAEQINECHWIDARIGRDTGKPIGMDIDNLEMHLMDILDQYQSQIESFNYWILQCRSLTYFDSLGGYPAIREQVNAMSAKADSIMS